MQGAGPAGGGAGRVGALLERAAGAAALGERGWAEGAGTAGACAEGTGAAGACAEGGGAVSARNTPCPLPQLPGTRGGPAAGLPGGAVSAARRRGPSGLRAVQPPFNPRPGSSLRCWGAAGPGCVPRSSGPSVLPAGRALGTAVWHGRRRHRKTSLGLCKRVSGVIAKIVKELVPLLRAVWV